MGATWTLKEHSTGDLVVTIEGEKWETAVAKAFNKLSRNLDIRGFRKGQVPKKVAEARISAAERQYEAAMENVDIWLQEGVAETGAEPISQPQVDINEITDQGVTLTYTYSVMPEVTLGAYKDIEYEVREAVVEDSEVNAEIDRMRQTYADIVVKETPAANGDTVNIDYKGFKDGVAFEGGEAENYNLELGSGSFIPGFEEQLVGVSAGEEKDLDLTFPEDYPAADLAGAAVVFHVKVNEVKEKVLPEVDDDFAKDCNIPQVETAEELRQKIYDTLLRDKKAAADQEADKDYTDALNAVCDVDIPAVLVENEIDAVLEQYKAQLQAYGLEYDQYLKMMGQTPEADREARREDAERTVKLRLVLGAIGKAEGIDVSDDELEAEYNNIAVQYDMDVQAVKDAIGASLLREDIFNRKTLAHLKEQAAKA